jgi:hypothetical protein
MSRLVDLFLEPAPPAAAPHPAPAAPRLTGVLAPATDLAATAGAVAAAARRGARARTAVVLRPGATAPQAATPAAAGLARRLAGRDVAATAAGTLCVVALPPDPAQATALVWRVAAAVDVPLVFALPGRVDGFDGLLAQMDRLVLAPPPGTADDLADLALMSLAALGPPAARITPPTGFLTTRAAALGLIALTDAPAREPVPAPPTREPRFEPPRAELRA